MQKFLCQLKADDRRTARKWSAVVLSLYGSIIAGLVLYTVLHAPNSDYAAVAGKSQAMLTKR
jgi:hypothetical protein